MSNFKGLNSEESIEVYIETYSELMDKPTIKQFNIYGKHQEKGSIFKGNIFGLKHTAKVFAATSDGKTFIVIEQYPDEDFKYVKEGLQLIEKSMVMKLDLKKK